MSYYGLCSFLDHQVGQVLSSLRENNWLDNTIIIYTSDHGDHNGDRRMWTKMSLFEESVGIPMILSGPNLPKDKTVDNLASLIDIYPTILENFAIKEDSHNPSRPGISLQKLATRQYPNRSVLCEYHDGGSPTGLFMLRHQNWKYHFYPGYSPELFDLKSDPGELTDLSNLPQFQSAREYCHQILSSMIDPIKINRQAFSDQSKLIEKLGGVETILQTEEFDFTPTEW